MLTKMQTGFLELSLLLIFFDCKSSTEPFLYQKVQIIVLSIMRILYTFADP